MAEERQQHSQSFLSLLEEDGLKSRTDATVGNLDAHHHKYKYFLREARECVFQIVGYLKKCRPRKNSQRAMKRCRKKKKDETRRRDTED